jgi:hypothetical protein
VLISLGVGVIVMLILDLLKIAGLGLIGGLVSIIGVFLGLLYGNQIEDFTNKNN